LVKVVHPDVAPAGPSGSATAAFARLSVLWAGRGGSVLTTGRGSYPVGALVAAGDIANLYAVDGDAALLKVPRLPGDNDLIAAEARASRTLERGGDPRHRAYAPRLVESFTHEDPLALATEAASLGNPFGLLTVDEDALLATPWHRTAKPAPQAAARR
jgi:hypothetical protein